MIFWVASRAEGISSILENSLPMNCIQDKLEIDLMFLLSQVSRSAAVWWETLHTFLSLKANQRNGLYLASSPKQTNSLSPLMGPVRRQRMRSLSLVRYFN